VFGFVLPLTSSTLFQLRRFCLRRSASFLLHFLLTLPRTPVNARAAPSLNGSPSRAGAVRFLSGVARNVNPEFYRPPNLHRLPARQPLSVKPRMAALTVDNPKHTALHYFLNIIPVVKNQNCLYYDTMVLPFKKQNFLTPFPLQTRSSHLPRYT